MDNRLRPFDREHVDNYVKRMVGVVPATVRLLLDLVASGVRLTPGGRLPRALVREVQRHHPGWHPLGKPAATDGKPITVDDVTDAVHQRSSIMKALDLVDMSYPVWSAGPSAQRLLPGATLRAEVWSVAMGAGSPS